MKQVSESSLRLVIIVAGALLALSYFLRSSGDAFDFVKGVVVGVVIGCFALMVVLKNKSSQNRGR